MILKIPFCKYYIYLTLILEHGFGLDTTFFLTDTSNQFVLTVTGTMVTKL